MTSDNRRPLPKDTAELCQHHYGQENQIKEYMLQKYSLHQAARQEVGPNDTQLTTTLYDLSLIHI